MLRASVLILKSPRKLGKLTVSTSMFVGSGSSYPDGDGTNSYLFLSAGFISLKGPEHGIAISRFPWQRPTQFN